MKNYISREDNLRKGTALTPWYSGQNKFATQAGSGGFLKVRDVLPHTEVSGTHNFINGINSSSHRCLSNVIITSPAKWA